MNLPKSRWLLLAVILDLPIIARLLWIQASSLTNSWHLGPWTRFDVALSVLFILTGFRVVALALKATPAPLLFWNLFSIALLSGFPWRPDPNRWNRPPIVYFEVSGMVIAIIAIGIWQIQSRQGTAQLPTPADAA
jgi:hypothetical protein